MRRRGVVAVIAVLLAGALSTPALAWDADFFEKDASGNATYEEMVISPEAIYDPATDRTYLSYQGAGLDPYVIAYDHAADSWDGPYRIGGNSLQMDSHGAPSMVIDDAGYLVVFYGGHLGSLEHARSARPHDISEWVDLGPVHVQGHAAMSASYPQPTVEESGTIRLYYRRDDDADGTRRDWETIVSTGSPDAFAWSEPEMVLHGVWGEPSDYVEYETLEGAGSVPVKYDWYADVDDGGVGTPALAAVRRDFLEGNETDFYVRKGVYYVQRSQDGTWTNAARDAIAAERNYASLQTTGAVVPETPGLFANQVVLRRDAQGAPFILYLAGSHDPNESYEWRFARWNGTSWDDSLIALTDDFFDAGVFELMPGGDIEAFLTTGGTPDDQWLDDPATPLDEGRYATRGGDITQWRSSDGGRTWVKVRDIITSPGPQARYNNPQIVRGNNGEARLLFSEWNNDASSFVHKVYLWGDEGFKQRAFTPEITRLAGLDRIATSIKVSRQGFPSGASVAVLATAYDFPDALCGVPLAQAYRAPVLLSYSTALDSRLAAELHRLDVSRVVILGGETAISSAVELSIKGLKNSSGVPLEVERLYGTNRYETSVAIARSLAEVRGIPRRVVLASGEAFPDALTVSPYAARRGYPVVLTPKSTANPSVRDVIAEFAPEELIIVGSTGAVSAEVESAYAKAAYAFTERWGGANRYETARIVAEHALDEGGHSMERFVLATGQNYADAVCGGLLAARLNGVLLITPTAELHPAAAQVIATRAFNDGAGVLDAFVLGGSSALSPEVENALAAQLFYLDGLASQ